MRILLASFALSIALIGIALAEPTMDWSQWSTFSWEQLENSIPAFAGSWTHTSAVAQNDDPFIIDPWTFTYTSISIDDPSKATSSREDPNAKVGATTQSISAFGDKNSGWGENGIMFLSVPLNPVFDNVAVAQTKGLIEAESVHQAWAVLPMESITFADSDESRSESWAFGAAISDKGYGGCHSGCCDC
jgi:hypothetical protein